MTETRELQLRELVDRWDAAVASGENIDIDALCGGSVDLAALLRQRIAIHSAIDQALAIDDTSLAADPELPANTIVGTLRILGKLGEGGSGTVYRAQRIGEYADEVAVKVLNRGLWSESDKARFRVECRALLRVKHRNVAVVHEAGIAADDRPFLVMELINGVPISDFAAAHDATIASVLRLFMDVCAAVAHAHVNGVIHRDLKPANVLVAGTLEDAIPKVIDFGIARLIADDEGDTTGHTHAGNQPGTIGYMSPEQLGVVDAVPDARTDIYSLGLMLVELVSGSHPYADAGGHLPARQVIEARLRTGNVACLTSQRRAPSVDTKRPRMAALTAGRLRELNWIIAKCLQLQPSDRYATCQELRDDIGRFLRGEALSVGPPHISYRLRAFARRHMVGVAVATVMAIVLLVAISAVSYGLVAARRGERQAQTAEQRTRAVSEFQSKQLSNIDIQAIGSQIRQELLQSLTSRLPQSSVPMTQNAAANSWAETLAPVNFTTLAASVVQHGVFEPAVRSAETTFSTDPELLGRILQTCASAQEGTGLLPNAEITQRRALDVRRAGLGDHHPDTLISLRQLGNVLTAAGRADEGEPLVRQALEQQLADLGPLHLDTLTSRNDHGTTLSALGRHADAEAEYKQALEGCVAALGPTHELTLTAHGNLAGALDKQDRSAEAERHYRAALDGMRERLGDRNALTILSINNMGTWYYKRSRDDEAKLLFVEALDLARTNLGDDHPTTLLVMSNAALLYDRLGDRETAEHLSRTALASRTRTLGPLHSSTLTSMINVSGLLRQQKKFDEAIQLASDAVQRAERSLGAEHVNTGIYRSSFGRTLAEAGDRSEAERQLELAHHVLVKNLGEHHQRVKDNAGVAVSMYTAPTPNEVPTGAREALAKWRSRTESTPGKHP